MVVYDRGAHPTVFYCMTCVILFYKAAVKPNISPHKPLDMIPPLVEVVSAGSILHERDSIRFFYRMDKECVALLTDNCPSKDLILSNNEFSSTHRQGAFEKCDIKATTGVHIHVWTW